MFIEKPEKCENCAYITRYGDIHVCGLPVHTPEESILDITCFKVDKHTQPDWCRLNRINKRYDSLSEDKKKAMMNLIESLQVLYS